jgi:hypothetical protein
MIKPLTIFMALAIAPELVEGFKQYFKRCIRGYHLINLDPIKEAVWESINSQVLTHSGGTVYEKSSGSHSPGSDISSSVGNFSNKSVKYDSPKHDHFNISSYRLTAVCSADNPGNISEIIAEIDKRKNFQYYSIIARDESPDKIYYDWFILPADHPALNPASYTWAPMLGKRGKKKDIQVGWNTNVVNGSSMSITFSMSSQLWISVTITDEMKEQYIVATTQVKKKILMDYVGLSEHFPDELVATDK